ELHGRSSPAAARIHVVERLITKLQVVFVLEERKPHAFAVLAVDEHHHPLGVLETRRRAPFLDLAFNAADRFVDVRGIAFESCDTCIHALSPFLVEGRRAYAEAVDSSVCARFRSMAAYWKWPHRPQRTRHCPPRERLVSRISDTGGSHEPSAHKGRPPECRPKSARTKMAS